MKIYKRFIFIFVLILALNIFQACTPDETFEPPEPQPGDKNLIIFDKGHGELAGNADWTIGSDPSYIGGYSDFGEMLREAGFETGSITYISSENLANASVLVLSEPNTPFSSSEINCMKTFVYNGGGLFMIGNHEGSDRDSDGYDSGDVLNQFSPENFGITFVADSWSGTVSNFVNPDSEITAGLSSVGCYVGCTILIAEPGQGHIWKNGVNRDSDDIYVATSTYGSGRVAAIGDSAIFDDGTGNPNNDLHANLDELSNAILGVNIIEWLAE